MLSTSCQNANMKNNIIQVIQLGDVTLYRSMKYMHHLIDYYVACCLCHTSLMANEFQLYRFLLGQLDAEIK